MNFLSVASMGGWGGRGVGGKQQNYKRNFVEQIQLDKVDSFTLQHKSKLLQIQTHLVFGPIKTHVCWTLTSCLLKVGFKVKIHEWKILHQCMEHWKCLFINYKIVKGKFFTGLCEYDWRKNCQRKVHSVLVNLLPPLTEPNLGNFVQLQISSWQLYLLARCRNTFLFNCAAPARHWHWQLVDEDKTGKWSNFERKARTTVNLSIHWNQ